MNSLELLNSEGKKVGTVDPAAEWDKVKAAPQAVRDCIVHFLAAQRKGTASTKTRSELSFSTRKPWRQKGTGRARVGSISSPIWRKGGIVFGPHPRDFSINLPKKVKQLALKNALVSKIKNQQVVIVDDLRLDSPKTKLMEALLERLKGQRKPLLVMKKVDRNVYLASRNLAGVVCARVADLNTYQVINQERLIITNDAWQELEKRLFTVN